MRQPTRNETRVAKLNSETTEESSTSEKGQVRARVSAELEVRSASGRSHNDNANDGTANKVQGGSGNQRARAKPRIAGFSTEQFHKPGSHPSGWRTKGPRGCGADGRTHYGAKLGQSPPKKGQAIRRTGSSMAHARHGQGQGSGNRWRSRYTSGSTPIRWTRSKYTARPKAKLGRFGPAGYHGTPVPPRIGGDENDPAVYARLLSRHHTRLTSGAEESRSATLSYSRWGLWTSSHIDHQISDRKNEWTMV